MASEVIGPDTSELLRVVKALSAFCRDIFSQNLLANQNRGIVCIIIPNFITVEQRI